MSPAVVIRPILLLLDSANHSAPSAPAAIPAGQANAVGTGYSVMYPAVVIRPILSPSCSVNHSAPSGPATIPTRDPGGPGNRGGPGVLGVVPCRSDSPVFVAELFCKP